MKEKFSLDKFQGFNILITLLLITQVALSLLITTKLIHIEKTGTFNIEKDPPPAFIENVSEDDDPLLGDINSPILIVGFGDYQCPFCKEGEKSIKMLLDEYQGAVAFVFRDYPLNSHSQAFLSALAANCAKEQGYFWEVHDLLYTNQEKVVDIDSVLKIINDIPLNKKEYSECVLQQKYKKEILNDIEDGNEYEVTGVPTYFINGYRVVGGEYEQIKLEIERQLNIFK